MESWQIRLKECRAMIDFYDTKIIEILNTDYDFQQKIEFIQPICKSRTQKSIEIAIIKKENNLPIYDAKREWEIMVRYGEENAPLVEIILEESRKIQEKIINQK